MKQSINARCVDTSGKFMEKYCVPSMRDIEALPWNGYKVVSTFSGGGGSCLGYRMAGYHVIYANEFVEEARNTYKANHPDSYLDDRDIREVTPESILEITGLKVGELDIFDGSPPCCAFSTCGIREKGWGKQREYSDDKTQRADDLFFEYIRIMNGLKPKVFIAENVSGLVKGTAKGYFKLILKAMKECGYNVKAALVNAKYCGVPQSRERIIFIGVRQDLRLEPVYPKPNNNVVTLREALDGIQNDPDEVAVLEADYLKYKWGYGVLAKLQKDPPKALKGSSVMNGSYFNVSRESMNRPCSTVTATGAKGWAAGVCHPIEDRKFTIAELKRIDSLPDDFVLTGTLEQQGERIGRMVPPLMMKAIAKSVQEEILDKSKYASDSV